MLRTTRYQAAIMRDDEILLIKHQEHKTEQVYWLLPGGGMGDGETETQCIQREVREETNLKVKIVGLLLDEVPHHEDERTYQRFKTYLCYPITTQAFPGYEPEPDVAALYAITDVGWYNINDETTWDEVIINDQITAPLLRRIRKALEKTPARLETIKRADYIHC